MCTRHSPLNQQRRNTSASTAVTGQSQPESTGPTVTEPDVDPPTPHTPKGKVGTDPTVTDQASPYLADLATAALGCETGTVLVLLGDDTQLQIEPSSAPAVTIAGLPLASLVGLRCPPESQAVATSFKAQIHQTGDSPLTGTVALAVDRHGNSAVQYARGGFGRLPDLIAQNSPARRPQRDIGHLPDSRAQNSPARRPQRDIGHLPDLIAQNSPARRPQRDIGHLPDSRAQNSPARRPQRDVGHLLNLRGHDSPRRSADTITGDFGRLPDLFAQDSPAHQPERDMGCLPDLRAQDSPLLDLSLRALGQATAPCTDPVVWLADGVLLHHLIRLLAASERGSQTNSVESLGGDQVATSQPSAGASSPEPANNQLHTPNSATGQPSAGASSLPNDIRPLCWDQIAAGHPLVAGHEPVTPELLRERREAFDRRWSWRRLHQMAQHQSEGSRQPLTGLGPAMAAWLDEGSYARLVLSRLPHIPKAREYVLRHLEPLLACQLETALGCQTPDA